MWRSVYKMSKENIFREIKDYSKDNPKDKFIVVQINKCYFQDAFNLNINDPIYKTTIDNLYVWFMIVQSYIPYGTINILKNIDQGEMRHAEN